MFYLAHDPENTVLDPGESERISTSRLAYMLQKLPSEIEAESYVKLMDMVEVMRMDKEIERLNSKSPRS